MSAKILIIDDDIKFIQEAINVLEAKNYDVCSNLDISEDIDIDSIDDPDLIILKIMMFGCGCEKCIKILKKFEKKLNKNNTPIIIVTDTKRDKYLSSECYMDIDWSLVKNTLNKPVNTSELLRCVNFTISKQKISVS